MQTESSKTTSVCEVPALTTGIHKEGVPAPATGEGTLLSASPSPTDELLTENLPQVSDAPAPSKGKLAAPAIEEDVLALTTGVYEKGVLAPAIGERTILSPCQQQSH
jgi:hypothetical protein